MWLFGDRLSHAFFLLVCGCLLYVYEYLYLSLVVLISEGVCENRWICCFFFPCPSHHFFFGLCVALRCRMSRQLQNAIIINFIQVSSFTLINESIITRARNTRVSCMEGREEGDGLVLMI